MKNLNVTFSLMILIFLNLQFGCDLNSDRGTVDLKQEIKEVAIMYSGKIGKKFPIQMDLKRRSNKLNGTLFNSFQAKKKVIGRMFYNEFFYLKEFKKGQESGSFFGRFFTPSKIVGVWTTPDGKSAFPFYLIKEKQYGPANSKDFNPTRDTKTNSKTFKSEN